MESKVDLSETDEATKVGDAQTPMMKQLTIIGRGECGKTSIVHRLIRGTFSQTIPATPIESEVFSTAVNTTPVTLKIFDTSGQDDYSRFRALTLPISDYVLICYSTVDLMSFTEVEDTIISMVKLKAPANAKVVLCGTKTDIKDDRCVSWEEGRLLSERIGAIQFFECSAFAAEGVTEIFDFIVNDIYYSSVSEEPKRGFFSRLFYCCG
ncbi:Ras-like protein gene family, member A [Pancytospora epiphaga]|nr:Ras-like protein gene family, member A [Pancytospora epiphaga]